MADDRITRRKLLRRTTALAGFCAGHGFALTAPVLSEFGYGDVQLASGPLQSQFEENHKLLLNLSEDSLLKPFRQREGLPAPGKDLGGWYDTYAFSPGASYGQWLSALARFYAATRDKHALQSEPHGSRLCSNGRSRRKVLHRESFSRLHL